LAWSDSRNAIARRSTSCWAPIGKSPSDSTFRLLLSQLDVAGFESLLRAWMTAQPGVAELDTLVCDGKTLRGSIAETDSGAMKFNRKRKASPTLR